MGPVQEDSHEALEYVTEERQNLPAAAAGALT